MMKNVKIKENIYLVGKIDDRDVPFHRLTLTKELLIIVIFYLQKNLQLLIL